MSVVRSARVAVAIVEWLLRRRLHVPPSPTFGGWRASEANGSDRAGTSTGARRVLHQPEPDARGRWASTGRGAKRERPWYSPYTAKSPKPPPRARWQRAHLDRQRAHPIRRPMIQARRPRQPCAPTTRRPSQPSMAPSLPTCSRRQGRPAHVTGAPHPHRRPVDTTGRPPGAPGARPGALE